MDTPQTPPKRSTYSKRKYTIQEKEQLLRNLDIEGEIFMYVSEIRPNISEVDHRTRQFERSLAHILENFRNHHEGLILRVPRLVRSVTMAEFGDKYHGDIAACLRGLQSQRHGGEPIAIDPATRKRKWQESQDTAPGESASTRAAKNG